jgi:monothiol glutaredoxin
MTLVPVRETFPEAHLHPGIREKIGQYRKSQIEQVKDLVAKHRVVIVGMSQNPFPKRARRLLDAQGIQYEYLGIGSYFSQWRARLVLKMWTGWPTFPMIFVDGALVGGSDDLARIVEAGELKQTLARPRAAS